MSITKTKVEIPFFIGAAEAHSPHLDQLPSNFDFTLEVDYEEVSIRQVNNLLLQEHLDNSYRLGLQLGVPSDDTTLGNRYVEDFLAFALDNIPQSSSILEIGCGTGYLSYRLKELGYEVTAVEPGLGYETFWQKYSLDVVNEFFPSEKIKKKYDIIIMYTVLEHISNPIGYLKELRNYLKLGGHVICSVPNCEYEIKNIDPSILIHEHFNYFTKKSLYNDFMLSNYEAEISFSNFGRSLYSCARPSESETEITIDRSELHHMINYVELISSHIEETRGALNELYNKYGLSVYCPARLLNVLDSTWDINLFDDSEYLHGKYLYPFKNPVQSRSHLLSKPSPELLIIGSITFGKKIQSELIKSGYRGRIILMENILKEKL